MNHHYCKRCHLEDLKRDKKIEIATAMKQHQEISKKMAELLLLKRRTNLLQTAIEAQTQILDKINEDLALITKSNNRKEEKLRKAKSRDFNKKFMLAEAESHRKETTLNQERQHLITLRRNFITQLMNRVFPISLPAATISSSTTHQETVNSEVFNTDSFEYDIIDEHGLSTRPHPISPHTDHTHLHFIGNGSLPANGVMTSYIKAVKSKKASSVTSPGAKSNDDCDEPLNDLVLSVPAALSLVAHSIWIIASTLDQALPHSLLLPVVICEYGRSDRKAQTIIRFLAKLNDNIMFLAFTQDVSPDSLTVGHTLKNLSVLVNHCNLGRNGPFKCYPDLLQYPTVRKKHLLSTTEQYYSTADWESEPPLLHTAQSSPDQLSPSQETKSDSAAAATAAASEGSCSDNDDELSEDSDALVDEWEEVQDLMVPTRFLPGFHGDRLEYGTSYSEYSQANIASESGHQEMYSNEPGSVQYSSGILDTISSLLGSGWATRK